MRMTPFLLALPAMAFAGFISARGEDEPRPATPPNVLAIKVSPEKQTLPKGQAGAVTVKAQFADGTERDVTAEARYQSSNAQIAAVAAGGKCTAQGYGEAAIVSTYQHRSAVASVAVPQSLPDGFPDPGANNKIDELVNAKLKELGIPASELCTDQEFLRRAFLDVIGTLPKPEETQAFLADKDPQKRSKLIERLLERPEYADYWTLKWGDLLRMKSEAPINMWPNAVQAYRRWVHESILKNKPYDQFVTELLTATGSNFRDPAVNYYRSLPDLTQVGAGRSTGGTRDPQIQAETTAVLFMGARLSCCRCHPHPTESWTQDDNLGMAAFFATVTYKKTKEYKEEIVCLDSDQVLKHPVTGREVVPKPLGGEEVAIGTQEDPRAVLAAWLTGPKNPWFARNAVNRVWFWLLGRGIVEEPDDMRPTNPPSNAQLLAFLEGELIAHRYDLKHIFRLILNSRTYQRSSQTSPWNAHDVAQFAHYPIKRLAAEPLMDAVAQVTEVYQPFVSYIAQPNGRYPTGFRAINLDDGSVAIGFLQVFGRPGRDTPFEGDRMSRISMAHELYLLNASEIREGIARSPRIERWLGTKKADAEIVEELYLNALARLPTEDEKQVAVKYLGEDPKTHSEAVHDLVWVVLNTKEFLFNH